MIEAFMRKLEQLLCRADQLHLVRFQPRSSPLPRKTARPAAGIHAILTIMQSWALQEQEWRRRITKNNLPVLPQLLPQLAAD